MRSFLDLFVQVGGLAICLLLPLWFNPLSRTPFEPAKVLFFQTITSSLVLASIVAFVIDRETVNLPARFSHWMRISNPLSLPIIGFGVAYLLATVGSINWHLSLWGPVDNPHGMITILCGISFFLVLARVLQTASQIDSFIRALLLGSVPVALYGIAQYLGLDPLEWIANPISPTFSTLGNANFLGAYLAMIVPFTLLQIVTADRREKHFRFGIILFLQIACLWLTLARGAWLGMMGATLAFLLVLAWRWRSRILLFAALAASIFGIVVFININTSVLRPLFKPTPVTATADLPPPKIETASIQTRQVIWSDTLGLVADRWLLGYGPGTFVHAFAERYPAALADTEGPEVWVSDPHNLHLLQLIEAGVIGLAIFVWILIAFAKLVLATLACGVDRTTQATLIAIACSVIAFLIQAQFNPVVIVLYVLFWLDLALGVGIYHATAMVS